MPMSEVNTSLRSASARSARSASASLSAGGRSSGLELRIAGRDRGVAELVERREAERAQHRRLLVRRPVRCADRRMRSSCSTSWVLPVVSPRWSAPPERAVPPLSRNLRDSPDLGSGRRVDRLSPSVRPAVDRPDLLSRVASLGRFVGLRDSGEVAPSAPRCRGLSRPRLSAVPRDCTPRGLPSVPDERRLHDRRRARSSPASPPRRRPRPRCRVGGTPARWPARASARSSRWSPRRSSRRRASPGSPARGGRRPSTSRPRRRRARPAPARPAAAPGPGSRPCRSAPPSPARPATG